MARLRADVAEQWARLEALAAEFPTDDTVVVPHPAHCWLRLLVEDKPSVLARVARQVARRKVNIETVVVHSLPDGAHTYLTLGLEADEPTAERVREAAGRLDSVLDAALFFRQVPGRPGEGASHGRRRRRNEVTAWRSTRWSRSRRRSPGWSQG